MGVVMSVAGISVCGAIGTGVVLVGDAANDAAISRSAADAAALAGAANGRSAADRAADLNHGVLVSYVVEGSVTRVIVEVGNARAEAAAQRVLVPEPGD